jgi:hypothetical protein
MTERQQPRHQILLQPSAYPDSYGDKPGYDEVATATVNADYSYSAPGPMTLRRRWWMPNHASTAMIGMLAPIARSGST